MQFFVVISVLIYLSQVSGECPRRDDLHCQMYDTTSCPAGTKVGATYINYNGKNCEGCRMCLPESAQNGCPAIPCPYESIDRWYPMDCGIFNHPQKAWIDGRSCAACETFTKDCSDLSWIHGGGA